MPNLFDTRFDTRWLIHHESGTAHKLLSYLDALTYGRLVFGTAEDWEIKEYMPDSNGDVLYFINSRVRG